MNENDILVLESLRDGYLDIVSRDLSFLDQEESIRSAFNNEINMLQFVIENINNPKMIEDNPYFESWINETIQKQRSAQSSDLSTFLKLQKLISERRN
jgi:hypothetical protein